MSSILTRLAPPYFFRILTPFDNMGCFDSCSYYPPDFTASSTSAAGEGTTTNNTLILSNTRPSFKRETMSDSAASTHTWDNQISAVTTGCDQESTSSEPRYDCASVVSKPPAAFQSGRGGGGMYQSSYAQVNYLRQSVFGGSRW